MINTKPEENPVLSYTAQQTKRLCPTNDLITYYASANQYQGTVKHPVNLLTQQLNYFQVNCIIYPRQTYILSILF